MTRKITLDQNLKPIIPDRVVIPYIQGDGIGKDIWNAAVPVLDAAVEKAYSGEKAVEWKELPAGEKGFEQTGEWLPASSVDAIREHRIAIKGPLMTPVGEGMRSLNVRIRQELDLYACIRPVRYYPPVPNPVKHPEKVNITVFRENTEDLYAGIECDSSSDNAARLIRFVKDELKCTIPVDSSIGIKPISPGRTKRLVARALQYAKTKGLKSVTLMHKGNIMKFTEGYFRKWGYEEAFENFAHDVITEDEVFEKHGGKIPDSRIMIKDRIADMVFAEVLLKPENFDVIACPNLNGDFISDALAAQVGGLGIAPGANVGDECAVFEATHGTAPDIAGKDMANPCSLILSGALMFDHMGWHEAAELVRSGVGRALASKRVTADLAGGIEDGEEVSCSKFGRITARKISQEG
ncbi:MAG: NADP-dependent isocitrate dehydrogenase [Desulfarculaceae bacterium]|nr:NADP-dependent isocitrate dehydrogenase [Desulfarculaceae bacterium]